MNSNVITLPQTNTASEKLLKPNRKVVFQPPFLQGYAAGYAKLRGCICEGWTESRKRINRHEIVGAQGEKPFF